MDYYPNELYHHGIKGMRWGVRRYQNPDGSLTAAGRLRYGAGQVREGARRAVSSARTYGSNAYKKAKATYNRKATKADIGKLAATAGVVAVAALAIKHRGAIKAGARIAGKYLGTKVSTLSSTTIAKGKSVLKRKAFNRKASREAADAYREFGWKTNNLRKRDKAFIDAGKGIKRKTDAAKGAINGKVDSIKSRASKATEPTRNAMKRRAYNRKASREAADAYREYGWKTNNLRKRDKAFIDASKSVRRRTDAAKTTLGNAKSNISRKRRISKQVNDAFNSPSRYYGTHSPSQIRRDLYRTVAGRAIGTAAGAAGGAALGNYLERKSGSTTKKKKKK